MNIGANSVRFGNSYKFHNKQEAEKKQKSLQRSGIDAEVEYRSSDGMLAVLTWIVHTNENGTKDLSKFRQRQGLFNA